MSIYVAEESLYSYPYDTMVGLMDEDEINSISSSSDFMEIYVNKAWGPVCNLGMEDADSVCRQLHRHCLCRWDEFNIVSNAQRTCSVQ